jgi:hypothetical protein
VQQQQSRGGTGSGRKGSYIQTGRAGSSSSSSSSSDNDETTHGVNDNDDDDDEDSGHQEGACSFGPSCSSSRPEASRGQVRTGGLQKAGKIRGEENAGRAGC